MRIFSKFHDYYDACMKYGIDRSCVYKREELTFDHEKEFPIKVKLKDALQAYKPGKFSYRHDHYEHGMIWFCGIVYPYVLLSKLGREIPRTPEYTYCYTLKQVEEFIMTEASKEERILFNVKGRRGKTQKHLFNIFFSNNIVGTGFLKKNIITSLCKIKVPCLRLHIEQEYKDPKLILNPRLTDAQFYRIVDPYSAYQELAMFISGVLGGESPPMVPIADMIRLEKHGFDKKWSFRKKVR